MSETESSAAAPDVTVIATVVNEERHLVAAVRSVLDQDYAGSLELVLSIGPSKDRTFEIAESLAVENPCVRLVESPTGRTPVGLNLAISAARESSTIIVRTDGHAQLPLDYVRRVVGVLEQTGAANAGGMMVPRGLSNRQRAVARAMSSRIGLGGERFHVGGGAGPSSTVYLGAFRKDMLLSVGGFDERYSRGQDWELNNRLRTAGEVVWFDPTIQVDYYPRATFGDLARQFFRTGAWRQQIMRDHPETMNLRYLAPPLAVAGLAGSLLGGLAVAASPRHRRWAKLGLLAPCLYAGGVVYGTVRAGAGLPARSRLLLLPIVVTMHMSWGSGFLKAVVANAEDVQPSKLLDRPGTSMVGDRMSLATGHESPESPIRSQVASSPEHREETEL